MTTEITSAFDGIRREADLNAKSIFHSGENLFRWIIGVEL